MNADGKSDGSIVPSKQTNNAALDGSLRDVPTVEDPVFGLHVPQSCPNVPSEVLNPRSTWEDEEAYDRTAAKLAAWGC